MVRGNLVGADDFAEIGGDALGHAAGVDEDERSAVLLNQFAEALVNFGPDFVGHDGFKR